MENNMNDANSSTIRFTPIDGITVHNDGSPFTLDLKPITVLVGEDSKSSVIAALDDDQRNRSRRPNDHRGAHDMSLRCSGDWTDIRFDDKRDDIQDPLRESLVWLSICGEDLTDMGLSLEMSIVSSWKGNELPLWDVFQDDMRAVGLCESVVDEPDWDWSGSGHRSDCLALVSKTGRWVPVPYTSWGTQRIVTILSTLARAYKGQTVAIVCPEMGLHPKTLIALVDVLLKAARRGVYLIVETNSSVVIRALTANVAEDDSGWVLDNLALHWFARNDRDEVVVTTADIRLDGSFGDWPCDITTTELDLARRVLVAGHKRRSSLERQGPT